MTTLKTRDAEQPRSTLASIIVRRSVVAVVIGLVAAYTAGVVSGNIGADRRIDLVTLSLIALALAFGVALLAPDILSRLKQVELAGFKFEIRERVHQMEQALSDQDRRITELLTISMSDSVFKHLCGIACLKEYKYRHFDLFRREIYFLKDRGFITLRPHHARVEFDRHFVNRNIVDVAEPTEAGWSIIQLRKHEIPSEIKADPSNFKAELPNEIRDALMTKAAPRVE